MAQKSSFYEISKFRPIPDATGRVVCIGFGLCRELPSNKPDWAETPPFHGDVVPDGTARAAQ